MPQHHLIDSYHWLCIDLLLHGVKMRKNGLETSWFLPDSLLTDMLHNVFIWTSHYDDGPVAAPSVHAPVPANGDEHQLTRQRVCSVSVLLSDHETSVLWPVAALLLLCKYSPPPALHHQHILFTTVSQHIKSPRLMVCVSKYPWLLYLHSNALPLCYLQLSHANDSRRQQCWLLFSQSQ